MRFAEECGLANGLGLLLRSKDATAWHGYHVQEPYALIGTASDCNVQLSDESIAPFHAYFQMMDDGLFVCDLTESRGVLVDDYSVTADWVDREASFQIGRYEVKIAPVDPLQQVETGSDSESTTKPDAEQSGWDDVRPLTSKELDDRQSEAGDSVTGMTLSMRSERGRLTRVRSSRDVSLVGRSKACKFALGSVSVANIHCSLVRTPLSVWVIDLGSRSGTRLNGQQVKLARVPDRSRLQVGRCRLDVDFGLNDDLDAMDTGGEASSSLVPMTLRPSGIQTMSHALPGGYSEELIRDLVDDVASSQQAAFEQARGMLVELLASQERMHSQQLDSVRDQNAQLLEVIRMLTGSQQAQSRPPSLPDPQPETPQKAVAGPDAAAPAAEHEPPPASRQERSSDDGQLAGEDVDDPEIHSAWVRGQLHVISENLKKEQERGVKKLLRGLMPSRSDDALK